MKMSVSVPDELWEAARRRVADESPSAVVQAALARLAADNSASSAYEVRPDMDDGLAAAIEAARARVLDDAREMFQAGYRQGVQLASELSFRALDWIVEVGVIRAAEGMAEFDYSMEFRRGEFPEGSEPMIESQILVKYVGRYADFTNSTPEAPYRPTIEGIDCALRDVWERVNAPTTGVDASAVDAGGHEIAAMQPSD